MRGCIYYFVVMILSSLSGIFLMKNQLIFFILSVGALIIFVSRTRVSNLNRISLLVIGVLTFINIMFYYSQAERVIDKQDFRVVRKFSKDIMVSTGSVYNKRYLLREVEDIDSIEVGMIVNLDGRIVKSNYFDIGVVGEVTDYNINLLRKDFYYNIVRVRSYISELFISNFGLERGGVLAGLTFGDTSFLDKDYKNDLTELGIIHILSVSGFHINLVFMVISKLLSFFPSILLTFTYLILTGVKVSGIRAFSMVFIKEMAPRVFRNYDAVNALCVSGILILFIKPYEILNLGFVYSFAATLGILLFNNRIKDYLYKLPKLLADPFALVLSAQIFVLPISIFVNRKLEFGFLIANILLVPFYSILMILGLAFIFVSFVPLISDFVSYIIEFIFDVIDGGRIFIGWITPKGVYLINFLVIFIICLYGVYFIRKYVSIKCVNALVCILSFVYLSSITLSKCNVEVGKYYDKRYVIVRNNHTSHLYLNGKLKDTEYLMNKLGVNKVFTNINNKEILFSGDRFIIYFRDESILIRGGGRDISVNNIEDNFKYYSDIYPQKYYFMF